MKKLNKLACMVLLLVTTFSLVACGGNKYGTYETNRDKLIDAGYNVVASQDQSIIMAEIESAVEEYNIYAEEENQNLEEQGISHRIEFLTVSDIKINKMIKASKGDLRAYFFYCSDDASAEKWSFVTYALEDYFEFFEGSTLGIQEKGFVIRMHAEVNNTVFKFKF